MAIRIEEGRDRAGVRQVNEEAFGQPDEASVVDALRAAGVRCRSLVAESGTGEVVGHILFSPVTVGDDGADPWSATALGPMCVAPARQRQGIGSRLVREGLRWCLDDGEPVVFVLGHPDYYPRFGFQPAPPRGLTCRWPVPGEVFMVAELRPGALRGRRGRVEYAAAFDACG